VAEAVALSMAAAQSAR